MFTPKSRTRRFARGVRPPAGHFCRGNAKSLQNTCGFKDETGRHGGDLAKIDLAAAKKEKRGKKGNTSPSTPPRHLTVAADPTAAPPWPRYIPGIIPTPPPTPRRRRRPSNIHFRNIRCQCTVGIVVCGDQPHRPTSPPTPDLASRRRRTSRTHPVVGADAACTSPSYLAADLAL